MVIESESDLPDEREIGPGPQLPGMGTVIEETVTEGMTGGTLLSGLMKEGEVADESEVVDVMIEVHPLLNRTKVTTYTLVVLPSLSMSPCSRMSLERLER